MRPRYWLPPILQTEDQLAAVGEERSEVSCGLEERLIGKVIVGLIGRASCTSGRTEGE